MYFFYWFISNCYLENCSLQWRSIRRKGRSFSTILSPDQGELNYLCGDCTYSLNEHSPDIPYQNLRKSSPAMGGLQLVFAAVLYVVWLFHKVCLTFA